ncbi:FtsX-like permease family protein [Defluviimonas sp. WL0002]|uniref:FtsX-like permease family protein n=1 Tax=Albidovulum marisflavi TaxID=2984159 RepID=A0ABT2ZDI3_9RHOB|nr:FtsX-like permease family protein [Defluviimonas sp. WL0002]MCV2869179.1 FtsX-like permease family protein [Defluviimonas sp. WL0002]
MAMHVLDRKLLRDLKRMWAQVLAIALVLACGVMILVLAIGVQRSLQDTLDAYYERNRFAEVFSGAKRAPESLLGEIRALPGVRVAETRIVGQVVLDVPGLSEPAAGRVISLPEIDVPALNLPLVVTGRPPAQDSVDEVMVTRAFADANGFVAGDRFSANLNGRKRELTITGTALSPEYIYVLGPGAMLPDNRRFGVLWMPRRALAAAFDLQGAFNDVSLALTREGRAEEVIPALDRILAPYGGAGAYGRAEQASHIFIEGELTQLRALAQILPPIFFVISAFLVNMVLARIVTLERGVIGLLKALGYSDLAVAGHFLKFASLVAAIGIVIGWAVGSWLAQGMARLYTEFFEFPYLVFDPRGDSYAISAAAGLVAAGLGAVQGVRRAVRMPPAVAMVPPAPPTFKRGLSDRLATWARFSQPSMMVLRGITRWPGRATFSVLAISAAVAMLMSASFFPDSLDEIIDTSFFRQNRQDAMLILTRDQTENVVEDVRHLPGVIAAEPMQYLPVVLRHGHLSRRIAIEARDPDATLSRVTDASGQPVAPAGGGIILSDRLAERLAVKPGDKVQVEVLTGRRDTLTVPVTDIATVYFGLGAYMDRGALARLLRSPPQASVVNIAMDRQRADALYAAAKETPGLAGTVLLFQTRASFRETISRNVLNTTVVYILIAVLITVGVTYNGARIQLSERARELASLRILGFSRAEVSYILMGELMLLSILAQPVGWLLGWAFAYAQVKSFSSDLYSLPFVMNPATYAKASLVVLAASAASALIVRRRIDSLDLVAVMKTRE